MAGRKKSKSSGTKKSSGKKTSGKYKSITAFSKTKKKTKKKSTKSSTKKKTSSTTKKKTSKKKSFSTSKKRKDWQIIPGKSMKELKKLLAKKKPKKTMKIQNNNRWHAKGKTGKVVAVVRKQSGTTHKKRDSARKALPPGWRISTVSGKPYFENRKNRSDLEGWV